MLGYSKITRGLHRWKATSKFQDLKIRANAVHIGMKN
jgi:hypothetical protein